MVGGTEIQKHNERPRKIKTTAWGHGPHGRALRTEGGDITIISCVATGKSFQQPEPSHPSTNRETTLPCLPPWGGEELSLEANLQVTQDLGSHQIGCHLPLWPLPAASKTEFTNRDTVFRNRFLISARARLILDILSSKLPILWASWGEARQRALLPAPLGAVCLAQ